jgi:putative alpha-1,2-mannosidase
VCKVWLNDKPLERQWLCHSEIEEGGVLRFAMSPEPARE